MEIVRENDLGFYNDQGIFTIPAKQYDTGRIFKFNIIDLCDVDLTNCEAYIRIAKPDGKQFQGSECTQISDSSTIIVDTSIGNGNQILTSPGCNHCELNVVDLDGKSLTTWNFNINVEARVHDGSNIVNLDSFDIIDKIANSESQRIKNEEQRKNSEEQRILNESIRNSNEEQRIIDEEQRIINENQRKQTFEIVLSEANTYANNASNFADSAQESEQSAKSYSDLSKSYAKGTGNQVRENDDTDNSEYYAKQSELSSKKAAESLNKVKEAETDALNKINDAIGMDTSSFVVDLETGHLLYKGGRFIFRVNNNNGHLEWGTTI